MENNTNTPTENGLVSKDSNPDGSQIQEASVQPPVGENPFSQTSEDEPVLEINIASYAELEEEEELNLLKAKADSYGVTYHPKIGYAKLAERLADHIKLEEAEAKDTAAAELMAKKAVAAGIRAPVAEVSKVKSRLQIAKEDALRLIRVNIMCMDPMKKEYEGEIFQASNSVVGTVKKMVPFNTDFHVPQILLNGIREARFQTFVERKDAKGRVAKEGKLMPTYAVNVLEPLSEKELKELAQRQAMAAGLETA